MVFIRKIKSSTWIRINCALTAFIIILLVINYIHVEREKLTRESQRINACCGFPCQNGGICLSKENGYSCDCSDTGYHGVNCERISFKEWINLVIKFNPLETCSSIINYIPSLWKIFNLFTTFKAAFTRDLYIKTLNWGTSDLRWTAAFDLLSVDCFQNSSFSARSLPPVPKVCPTPMGIRGSQQLPSIDVLFEKVLKRKRFEVCPKQTNLLFASYIQHFVSQFENYETENLKLHGWRNSVLDMSHIYGRDDLTRQALRLFKEGKLKSRFYKGEEYPPFLDDCPGIMMVYPQTHGTSFISKMMLTNKVYPKWALGNPILSMTPMLFILSTIWLREHNRICSILAKEYKHWDDEQLYQTAKLIITGEVIKITLTEYMQHFMQFPIEILYMPKLTKNLQLQYTATVPKEFSILPHWHSLMPEHFTVDSRLYNMSQLVFTNNMIVFEYGFEKIIHAMTTQSSGKITYNNVEGIFAPCIKHLIDESRGLRIQSYNNYRRKFSLKPAESFEELTGDFNIASILKELYSDIEAVELIVGLLVERTGPGVGPSSITTMSAVWLVRGLISHPINSPNWWKPSTFGGKVGMNLIETTSLKKLICLNMKNKCNNLYVGFKTPNISVPIHIVNKNNK